MNKENLKSIEENFNIKLNYDILDKLNLWEEMFLNYNSHTNLISKNDEKYLFEKHVFDSFGILKFISCDSKIKIVDVGTGGGFPSLILAIFFNNFEIVAVDSIKKKTDFLNLIKEKLELSNLKIITNRIENIENQNADVVTSRAVSRILKVYDLSKKHIKKGGKFLIYKALNYEDELLEFQKKYKNLKIEIKKYELLTAEHHKRCIISVSN